jgi:hypothetical protein
VGLAARDKPNRTTPLLRRGLCPKTGVVMHRLILSLLALALGCGGARAQVIAPAVPTPPPTGGPAADTIATPALETIVFIRHGEKPADDKGQLTCQGLNRALALPKVLLGKFGRPDFIFAPLTAPGVFFGHTYCYLRPLMTIEPTAITAGLPVNWATPRTRFPSGRPAITTASIS